MEKASLTRDATVQRQTEVLSTQTPDETFALDVASGACFAFNGPSARIWELMELPIQVGHLVHRLVDEYEIEEEDCLTQTLTYLNKLLDEGLISVADSNRR